MADIFTEAKRSETMSKIRSRNTKPEVRVRRFLFSRGLRYRLYSDELPGHPDIIFSKQRVVIFVNGCFWHGHPCKIGSGDRRPKTRVEYWERKIDGNIKRDKQNVAKLIEAGWKPLVIWECETQSEEKLIQKLSPVIEMIHHEK